MAEVIGDFNRINKNALTKLVENETVSVTASATTLISAIDVSGFEYKCVQINNGDGATGITAKVWASNKDSPGAVAGAGWAQIGSDITIAASGEDIEQWVTPCRHVAVSAATASGTATSVDAYLFVKTS